MRPGLSEGIAQLRSASAPRRSCISVVVVTAQPLPTSETRNSGSTLASVKNTWLNEAYPFICRNGCTVTPGCFISRMKYDRPRCFGWSKSVRASKSPQCALCAPVVHAFCPLDRKSTRLNSSHLVISYAVFCLKKKKEKHRVLHALKKKTIKSKKT